MVLLINRIKSEEKRYLAESLKSLKNKMQVCRSDAHDYAETYKRDAQTELRDMLGRAMIEGGGGGGGRAVEVVCVNELLCSCCFAWDCFNVSYCLYVIIVET